MYQFLYTEIVEDGPIEGRAREHEALVRAIDMMRAADAAGAQSVQAAAAIYKMRMLWSLLIENAALPTSELPDQLRARMISIGIWVIGELEDIRNGKTTSFHDLIEVTETIAKGLK